MLTNEWNWLNHFNLKFFDVEFGAANQEVHIGIADCRC